MDASYPKDRNPENWRTIQGAKVHLTNGKIDGGAGGKFHGRPWMGKIPHKNSSQKQESETGIENNTNGQQKMKESIRANINSMQADYDKKLSQWKTNWTPDIDNEIKTLGKKLTAAKVDAAKQGVIFASGLSKKLDKSDVDAIVAKVEKAPEHARIVWNRFEDTMKVSDANYTGKDEAHYSTNSKDLGIYVNINVSRREHPAFNTIFHELGHLIDHRAGGDKYCISSVGDFRDTLKQEADDYVKAVHKKMKEENPNAIIPKKFAYFKIQRELESSSWNDGSVYIADVSDIFSGATRNRVKDGAYHPTTYWTEDDNNLPAEAFANMLCATIHNPSSVKQIKKYFPKSYGKFEEIIKEIAEGGKSP